VLKKRDSRIIRIIYIRVGGEIWIGSTPEKKRVSERLERGRKLKRGSVKENKMPTSLAKKKKMAFQTSIAFKDLERAKNDQSSMRVSVHQLSVEASVFNDAGGTNGDDGDDGGNDEKNQMSFANVYKKESELVVAGFWFPTKGEKVTCDVLDVFLLLCPNGASVAMRNVVAEGEDEVNGKALKRLHEEMLSKNKSAVVMLPNERELHIVAVRKDGMMKEEKEKKSNVAGAPNATTGEKKISVGFYEDDEDEDNEKKKKKKEEEDASSTLKSESESYFLGFEIPSKSVFEANLLLENSQFVVILDLDETLLQAASEGTLERAIENERRKMIELDGKIETLSKGGGGINNNIDENNRDELSKYRRERQETEQRRRFLMEDHRMLKEFREGNAVRQGALLNAKNEKALVVDKLNPNELKMIERPVVRLASKYRGGLNGFTMFTRIDPNDPNSSILVHVRPGWFGPHGLKEALSGINRASKKRLAEVYVCTTAEKEYAMEMWRILDGDFSLIDERDVRRRVVSLYGLGGGARKSFKMAWEGNAKKWPHALSLIIDDRSNVWAETEQPHVITVHPFLPNGYIEPESNSIEKDADAANSNGNNSNSHNVNPAAVLRRERETFLERELPGKGGVLGSALGMLNAARTRWFYEFQKYRKDKRMRMFEESFESNDTDDGKVEAEKEDAQNVSAPPAENGAPGGDGGSPAQKMSKNASLELPSLNKILPEIMAKEAQELASALKARAGVSRTATGAGSALDSILAPLHRSIVENEKMKKEKREKEEREKREQMQKEKEEREKREREEHEAAEAKERAEREAEEARWEEERVRRKKEREEKDEAEEQKRKEKKRISGGGGSGKKLDKDETLDEAGQILEDAKKKERAAEVALKKAKKEQQRMLKELEVEKSRKAAAEKRKATREAKNGSASKKKKKKDGEEETGLVLDDEMDPEAWNATLDEIPCKVCKSKDDDEKMLLCDGCDCGFHIFCLKPPMKKIPEGDDDWFCKPCKAGVERMTKSVEAKVALRVAMQELPESYQEEAIKICKVANGLDEDADEEIVIDVAELEPKTLWRLNLVCDRAKDEQT